eukprot:TRINITY_DN24156_c0_g1_i1.p1 TRINITY_DN24156_c0_g1~~TRINITY_DN24156_c0_g1_i1.p1  ORF type:complete len:1049 (-),score=208.79 TRINITY_DN24156_c0_g1_i1:193-3339(-)
MRKKVDSRVRTLVENGVKTQMRSLFVIVGDRGKDQVVNLHYMVHKISNTKPSVLWCYKKELGFSSNKKSRMKMVKKKMQRGQHDPNVEDPFELFISSTNINYCYYKDTERVLGKTFGMCILQDFEALTPNLLCRVIETVEGGGIVLLLLKTMDSLKQLYSLSMDSHTNLRTETHTDFEPRFNERLVLSLKDCPTCLVVDDELNILPISKHIQALKPLEDEGQDGERPKTANERELDELKATTADAQPLGPIVGVSRTLDQAKAVMSFVDAISEKSLNRTMALTAGRGRGKSAALGLAISAAVAYGYSNIFVTAPSPENLTTVFEFILKGFDALGMQEHQQYELVQAENPELNKALVRVNIFKDHRQTVQYINPSDWQHLAQAELLVVDEAAAIPLPIVKKLLGPYLVLLASTVNGYEGTGRALSLKLIEDLKKGKIAGAKAGASGAERTVKELQLQEPIRYAPGDHIEAWLNRLLCLDAAQVPTLQLASMPVPSQCSLFLVNRDALFSHHEASEKFLFKMMSLFVSSHYKNSPNDLLLMADAPAHHLLVLLPPIDANSEQTDLPEVLVAIQVCMEGALSQESVRASLKRGLRPSGDLIPWTLTQQFLHDGFAQLNGARVVRIATHPSLQRKGYASEAMKQMIAWFEQKARGNSSFSSVRSSSKKAKKSQNGETEGSGKLLEEELAPREVPPLLEAVAEVPPPYDLDYVGTSFGLTYELYEFWRRSGMRPVYLRQQPHQATGEHSCILLRALRALEGESRAAPVIDHFVADFRLRFLRLLQGPFAKQPTRLALSVVDPPPADAMAAAALDVQRGGAADEDSSSIETQQPLTASSLLQFLSRDDIHRLEQYGRNLSDYALILDIVPAMASLFLSRRMPEVKLSPLQCAILLAVGCQHRTFDEVAKDFNAPASQLLALFNKAMHKLSNHCRTLLEQQVEEEDEDSAGLSRSKRPLKSGEILEGGSFIKESLKAEQQAAGQKVNKKLDAKRQELLSSLGNEFAVAPGGEDFEEALGGRVPTSGTLSVQKKRPQAEEDGDRPKKMGGGKKQKG